MRTFAVDDVEAVTTPLPRAHYDLAEVLGAAVLARSPDLEEAVQAPRVDPFGVNGLALAVHLAFAEHRPLALSPDAVWLAILQGFALHVRLHDEALRERLVRHQGKRTLSVTTGSLADAAWPAIADRFAQELAREVNPGLLRALTAPFSTTGPTEHTAHCVGAMDAFSRFFDYEVTCICGIPSVTLLGTPADWRAVRERFRVLAELGLQWWAERLDPVLEQLVESAEGHPDPDFWRCLYKPKEAYGGELATGWLVRFFPYLEALDGTLHPSPMARSGGPWVHEPVDPGQFPSGLSKVVVRVQGPSGEAPQLLSLFAGFFGVAQEPEGRVRAHLGWALAKEPTAALWEDLSRAHRLAPSRPDRRVPFRATVPALLLEFYDHFDGGQLYDGELVLAPAPAAAATEATDFLVNLRGQDRGFLGYGDALRLGHLRDGSVLLWYRDEVRQKDRVFLWRRGQPPPYPVVAYSLLEFYQRLATVPTFPPWEVRGRYTPLFD